MNREVDMEPLLFIMISIIAAEFIFERTLSFLNDNYWSPKVPDEMKDFIDQEKYKVSQEYSRDRGRLSIISSSISTVVSIVVLALGGFGWLDGIVRDLFPNNYLALLAFFGIIGIIQFFISLPFSIYSTFVIEEKYGFNRTTPVTFFLDRIKGLILSAVIGGLLLFLFSFFYFTFPKTFWLYAWILFTGFSLFITAFYTSVIVPLFNKLTPLEEGELFDSIKEYAKSVDFPLDNILIMDGSKRSSKGNAFFSGLGSRKNIILFDTIIEKHPVKELVAVLAHEVGHYKKKHILINFLLSSLTTLVTLAILFFVIDTPELSTALGGTSHTLQLGLVSFGLLYSPVSTITGILMNILSRKHEYQADAWAAETYSPIDMAQALKRLSVDTLSNLRPHPAYVAVHYSHPTVLQRVAAVKR
jgi:STE24 endopeptidase